MMAGLGLVALVGCQPPTLSEEDVAVATPVISPDVKKLGEFKLEADAGVRVDPKVDPTFNLIKEQIAVKNFGGRTDPFALLAIERAFDRSQQAERLVGDVGWTVEFEPKVEEPIVVPEEPQPYRRLCGVLIGNSVWALIVMEDGKVHMVRPGQQIPGSEWKVESIDQEQAVLVRDPNKRPSRIVVRLEVDPTGGAGAPAGGGNTGGAGPGRGGRPGDEREPQRGSGELSGG